MITRSGDSEADVMDEFVLAQDHWEIAGINVPMGPALANDGADTNADDEHNGTGEMSTKESVAVLPHSGSGITRVSCASVASGVSQRRTVVLGNVEKTERQTVVKRMTVTSQKALSQSFTSNSLGPSLKFKPIFNGSWTCIDTWGLDDFLKASGIGWLQRTAAVKAPWPSWEFIQPDDDPDLILFTNRSGFGVVEENMRVDGPEYTAIDAKKQKVVSKAYWQDDLFLIDRAGPQGKWLEKRSIDNDGKLQFTFVPLDEHLSAAQWGRVFIRSGT